MWFALLIVVALALLLLMSVFVVIEEREEGVLERLGKFHRVMKSGFRVKIPVIDKVAYRHETREQVFDIPPQEAITKNNVQVHVDGLIYLKVMDVYKASYNVDDYKRAAIAMAQATMRSEIGKQDLDDTFAERERMNDNIVSEIDEASEPWGVKVLRYEVKNITPSTETIKNMEQKMESERLRREENIKAEGERDSVKLESEGQRQAEVNISEGVRQKTINEAEGRAREIQLVADASAQALRRIGEAASMPGGDVAIRTQLVQRMISQLQQVLETANVSVLPADLAGLRSATEAVLGARDGASAHAAAGFNPQQHPAQPTQARPRPQGGQ